MLRSWIHQLSCHQTRISWPRDTLLGNLQESVLTRRMERRVVTIRRVASASFLPIPFPYCYHFLFVIVEPWRAHRSPVIYRRTVENAWRTHGERVYFPGERSDFCLESIQVLKSEHFSSVLLENTDVLHAFSMRSPTFSCKLQENALIEKRVLL